MEFAKQLGENNLNFDQTVFNQFASEGSEYVWTLLKKQIDADIKRLKITSKIAKSNLLKGINAKADGFKPIHQKILAGFDACQNNAEDITISQGKSILIKEELERKRQELSVFIETELQQELWKILETGSQFFNDLEAFLEKRKLLSIFKMGAPDGLGDYVIFEKNPKFEIPESQKRLGFMMPMAGGIICKPNPEAIESFPE